MIFSDKFYAMTSSRLPVLLLVFFVLVEFASAQRNRRDPSVRYGRNSLVMKETLDDLAEATLKATCQIRDGEKDLILGTVFSSEGWVVTKSSEIQDVTDLKCVFGDDSEFSAKVVATDEKYDLALLKIEGRELVAVEVAEEVKELVVGQIVLSCDEDGEAMSMGLITAKPRKFNFRQRPAEPGRGYLGVSCRPSEEGLRVSTVREKSGAEGAGLKEGDIIVKMEGTEVKTTAAMIKILTDHKPKERVQISVIRGEKSLDLEATLGRVPNAPTDRSDKWGGGPFSERRFNFPKVIPHDSAIRPEECGGPLLNSDGEVIGINIARAFRVATYAVPVQVVKDFVEKNQPAEDASTEKESEEDGAE